MKAIDCYKMFDPMKPDRGLPAEKPGNYIFLLRSSVKLPEDMIQEQPTFTTLEFEGAEYEVLYTGVTSRTHWDACGVILLFSVTRIQIQTGFQRPNIVTRTNKPSRNG